MINVSALPVILQTAIAVAMSHYPSLCDTEIHFEMIDGNNNRVMAAQPIPSSLFKGRESRAYVIKISEAIDLGTNIPISIDKVPENVLIGWIGHELGHVMDYENRDLMGMIGFGIGYVVSSKYRREAEYTADTFAIESGLGSYILETKSFILNNADIPEKYKSKIRKHYMSPELVLEKVQSLSTAADSVLN